MVRYSFASLLFRLSFSTTSPLPPITPSELPPSQTTWASSAASAKGEPAGENSTPASPASSAGQGSPVAQQADPLKRPLPEKKKKLSKESLAYKDWADKEVRWIITDEEREAFKLLTNDEEREKFVESFWIRRDPTPDTVENEFRDQYYQRVLYANERFSAGIPGSMTDRGRIYIIYGPPDEIESHPSGGTYDYPSSQGGGSTQTFPLELWRYRYIADAATYSVFELMYRWSCSDY